MSTAEALFVFFTAVFAIRQVGRVAVAAETIASELTKLRTMAEGKRQ